MSPAPPSGATSFKKKDGILALSNDRQSVAWTSKAGSNGSFTIQIVNITNLQQTPVNNPKVMLKIFAQQEAQSAGADKAAPGAVSQYVFLFTSGANARPEADAIKEALSAAIQSSKAALASATLGSSAAMAVANAVSVGGRAEWQDGDRLKANVELQQSLLKSDASLQRVFMESLRTKPDSVSSGQFVSQFWSTRIHLLRAHAIENSQARGSYNVLSSLKPRVEDNVTKLNISKEQIQLIFSQHPLIKRVYDENVPKLTEQQFWSRFFQSRLFKKLRGERITESDATDALLDKYLKDGENHNRLHAPTHVPHIIDLQGNEENDSEKQGNRQSFDMRPTAIENVHIIRTLNNLSEKIIANVAPVDRASQNLGEVDDETFRELQLRDLQGEEEQTQIALNIRDQSRFFAEDKETEADESRLYSQQDPREVLKAVRADFLLIYPDNGRKDISLRQFVEPEEDDSSDDESRPSKEPVGSKASLASATSQIFEVIKQRRADAEAISSSSTCGLSQAVFNRLTLTHATTMEFLNHFWQVFLSGDPDRVNEIASLVESLDRAMDRIKAVALEAEAEREAEIQKLKQHAREVMASTGRNIRPNFNAIEGGEKVVNQLMAPTINTLAKATAEYKMALVQQSTQRI